MAAGYAQILHGAAVGGASVQDLSNLISYVFASSNSGSGSTGSTVQNPTSNTSIPEVVRSRINIANGRTRFTPLRDNGNPVSAGLAHVIDRHFRATNSQSKFTISLEQLKAFLQRSDIVGSPVTTIGKGNQVQFVRTVNTNIVVGTVRQADGGGTTTWIKIFTDRAGNLITTYPVQAP
jgi:hypothetical protein